MLHSYDSGKSVACLEQRTAKRSKGNKKTAIFVTRLDWRRKRLAAFCFGQRNFTRLLLMQTRPEIRTGQHAIQSNYGEIHVSVYLQLLLQDFSRDFMLISKNTESCKLNIMPVAAVVTQ